jgi:hypothetical protein
MNCFCTLIVFFEHVVNFGISVVCFRFYNLSTKSTVTDDESYQVDSFDNSLALVPANVNMTATSQSTNNHKSVNNISVFQALDALRVAKEKLQSSMGT